MPLATSSSSSSIPSIAPTIEPMRRSIKPFELQSSDGNILIQSLYQIFLEIVIFLSTTDMKVSFFIITSSLFHLFILIS